MEPRSFDDATPATALLTTRLFWALLLGAQVFFALFVYSVASGRTLPGTTPEVVRLLSLVTVAALLILVPLGYYVRGQTYKKHWRGHAIAPRGYISGNLPLLLMCAAVSVLGLVTMLVQRGWWWPTALTTAAAVAVQVVNFPNGRAMEPVPP
jgi:hypothetical protein